MSCAPPPRPVVCSSAAGTFRIAMDVFDSTLSWASKSFGLAEQCPYVDDPISALAERLPASISGQEQGVGLILDTFSSWEFSRKAGYQQALVLAVTGPTGVGESRSQSLTWQHTQSYTTLCHTQSDTKIHTQTYSHSHKVIQTHIYTERQTHLRRDRHRQIESYAHICPERR